MNTKAGRVYRVTLELQSATLQSPTWMVGALGARYPRADLLAVERYDGSGAVVLLRWRRGTGRIEAGDVISAAVEGLQVPGEALPSGTVTDVALEPLYQHPQEFAERALSLSPESKTALQVLLAVGILVGVAYLSDQIREKEEEQHEPRAGQRAAA